MTFLETLRAHRGGLLRLKGELFWYGGRGWDGTPDRICLVLDAAARSAVPAGHVAAQATPLIRPTVLLRAPAFAALLLIDGAPHWVWVAPEDVEIL